mmetsp:Transcript_39994/g.103500  ORF Transcript_39994/g.103500 Transcript_39994/m.103500 type:complete len:370 (-) Transcript_39994:141-1250(-)
MAPRDKPAPAVPRHRPARRWRQRAGGGNLAGQCAQRGDRAPPGGGVAGLRRGALPPGHWRDHPLRAAAPSAPGGWGSRASGGSSDIGGPRAAGRRGGQDGGRLPGAREGGHPVRHGSVQRGGFARLPAGRASPERGHHPRPPAAGHPRQRLHAPPGPQRALAGAAGALPRARRRAGRCRCRPVAAGTLLCQRHCTRRALQRSRPCSRPTLAAAAEGGGAQLRGAGCAPRTASISRPHTNDADSVHGGAAPTPQHPGGEATNAGGQHPAAPQSNGSMAAAHDATRHGTELVPDTWRCGQRWTGPRRRRVAPCARRLARCQRGDAQRPHHRKSGDTRGGPAGRARGTPAHAGARAHQRGRVNMALRRECQA